MIRVDLTVDGVTGLAEFAASLQDPSGLHARMAGEGEKFVKARGAETAAGEHRTANRLGANPTGHLAEAYEGIEGVSDESSARLLIPGATRLRAAFGRYVLEPRNGSRYLTIPVHRDAYGRRAREIDDLFFMRVGPRKTPVLARRTEGEENTLLRARPNQRRARRRFATAEILYVLVGKVTIEEDRGLIPFDDLAEEARDSAEAYIDEQVERSLA
jgi:hypothetical protein